MQGFDKIDCKKRITYTHKGCLSLLKAKAKSL